MPCVLYIARPQNGGPLKIGQTSGAALSRVRRLGGQSLLKYELVRVFETDNPRAAEAIAFDWLNNQGHSRIGGPRDEHVNAPLAVAIKACEVGAAGAKKVPAYAGRHAVLEPVEAWQQWCWPKTPLWDAVAEFPLTLSGRRGTLRELACRAVKGNSAQNRLRKMGIELVCFQEKTVEFRVEWSNVAPALREWVAASLPRLPANMPPVLKLRAMRLAV